jgi:hypothetical protein
MTTAEHRLIEMLAASEDGCDAHGEALLMAHGFTFPLIADVVNAGFAVAKTGRILSAQKQSRSPARGSQAQADKRWRNSECRPRRGG